MFSKNKSKRPSPAAVEANKAPGKPVTPLQPQKTSGNAPPSIISTDLMIQGHLVSSGDIQIDGNIEGDIRSGSMTIGEQATIHGDIMGDMISVQGRVVGSIRGRKVQLCSTCHVEGDITHESLAMEPGAFFEGSCRHSDDPLALPAQGDNNDNSPISATLPTSGFELSGIEEQEQDEEDDLTNSSLG